MKTVRVKLVRIGNSRGIRIPAALLKKNRIGESLLMEVEADKIVLRPTQDRKLSWKETFAEMKKAKENWSDLEVTTADGLDEY
jgi:antitoxin MazE